VLDLITFVWKERMNTAASEMEESIERDTNIYCLSLTRDLQLVRTGD